MPAPSLFAVSGDTIIDTSTGKPISPAEFNTRATDADKAKIERDLTSRLLMANQQGEGGSASVNDANLGEPTSMPTPQPSVAPGTTTAGPSTPVKEQGGVPTLESFLAQAKPLNPDYSDIELAAAYRQVYPDAAKLYPPPLIKDWVAQAKAINPDYSDEELQAAYTDVYGVPAAQDSSSFARRAADIPLGLAKGVAGLPGAAVGLADTITGGGATRLLAPTLTVMGQLSDTLGLPAWARPAQWASQLGDLYSPETKANLAGVHARASEAEAQSKAEGGTPLEQTGASMLGAIKGVAEHPGALIPLAAENYAGMKIIAMGVAKVLAPFSASLDAAVKAGTMTETAANKALGSVAVKASAIGEGLLTTGQVGQAIQEKDPNADFTHRLSAAVAGLFTGGIAKAVGSIPGLGDVPATMATAALGRSTGLGGSALARVGKGILSEGVLQEPAQSGQEAAFENIGASKPYQEGIGEQVVLGAATGGVLGGTMASISGAPAAAPPPPTPDRDPLDAVAPIMTANSIDAAIAQGNRVAAAQLDLAVERQQPVRTFDADRYTESHRAVDQQALEHMFDRLDDASAGVRRDASGAMTYHGTPVSIVSPAELPAVTAPEQGLSKEKWDVLNLMAQAFGKSLIVFQAGPNLPDGAILQQSLPNSIFLSTNTTGADTFSVFAHEALHHMEGTAFHDAFRKIIWEQLTPEAKSMAKARHGILPSDDLLLNEIASDVAGTELHKPEVWDKVFAHLREQVGDEQAKTEVLGFIDYIKSLIARVKALVEERPWVGVFGESRKTMAEQYVIDLTKVHDALAAAVGNALHETRAQAKTSALGNIPAQTESSAVEKGMLALSKRSTSDRTIVPPDVAQTFAAIADAQRGAPEDAMLEVQTRLGGGVMSQAVEHAGDLIHRMTERAIHGIAGRELVREKVDKLITSLTHTYGFEKEHAENLVNNARYYGKSASELTAKVTEALKAYANAHRTLPVYNLPQWLARAVAVSVGDLRIQDAAGYLNELKRIVDRPDFTAQAFQVTRDANGKLEPYLRPIPARLIGIQKTGSVKIPDFALYNIEHDIPGHPSDSTLSDVTLHTEGFRPVATDLISKQEATAFRKQSEKERLEASRKKANPTEKEKLEVARKKLEVEPVEKLANSTMGHPLFSPKSEMTLQDRLVAKAYDAAPILDTNAVPAWDALKKETERLYQDILTKVNVERVTGQPYADAASMNADIAKGSFKVTIDHSEHPLWDIDENFKFRVVHDYIGHFELDLDFSLDGERRAYEHHAAQLQDPLAKNALKVEVYGQAAAAIAHDGAFQPQKIFTPSFSASQQVTDGRFSPQGTRIGTEVLPDKAKAPAVKWNADPLRTTPEQIAQYWKGTGWGTGLPAVYQAYVPKADVPKARIPEMAGVYDWAPYKKSGVYPPITIVIHANGIAQKLDDGNHRVDYWRAKGFTHFPAWIVDFRPTVKKAMVSKSPSELPVQRGEASITRDRSFEDRYAAWLNGVATRAMQEDAAQDVLDDLELRDISPQDVVARFWEKTYPGLDAQVQARFQRLIKANTGMQIGSIVAVNHDTKVEILANTWDDIFPANEVASKVEYLEGGARGLVALMEIANQRNSTKGPTDITPASSKQVSFSPSAWFSGLGNMLAEKMPAKASVEQVRNLLTSPGVKQDEVKWTGIQDYLDRQTGPVDKHNLLAWLALNNVQIEEVTKRQYAQVGVPKELQMDLREFGNRWSEGEMLEKDPEYVKERQAELDAAWAAMPEDERPDEPEQYEQDPTFSEYKYTHHDFPEVTIVGSDETGFQVSIVDAQGTFLGDVDKHGELDAGDRGFDLKNFAAANEAAYEYLVAEPRRKLEGQQSESQTRYEGYKEPGGNDYTELLLTWKDPIDKKSLPFPARAQIRFQSAHWGEPNILAHVRFDTRMGADGKTVLFLEEVQSDWHEQGREKGYRSDITEAERTELEQLNHKLNVERIIPSEAERERYRQLHTKLDSPIADAPFSKTWPELVMKRMLRYASEHGADRLAWTTGAMQNARYGLSKHIDSLEVAMQANSIYTIIGHQNGKIRIRKEDLSESELAETIGKKLAQRAIEKVKASDFLSTTLTGLDLEIGGSGMKYFYDQMLPKFMEKYLKKFGTNVASLPLDMSGINGVDRSKVAPVHAIDITPAMKESVLQGQPLFSPAQNATPKPAVQKPPAYMGSQPGRLDRTKLDTEWAAMPEDKRPDEPVAETSIPRQDTSQDPIDYNVIPTGVMIQLESIRASTGDTLMIKEDARVALRELDASLVRYQQLKVCLSS